MSFHWNHPFFFILPSALLKPGDNALLLRVRAEGGFGLLAPLQLGDAAELRVHYERRRFWQAEVHGALALLLAGIATLALGIWSRRRHDSQYLWLGLSCLAWCAFAVFLYGRDFPLDPLLMQWLAQAGTLWWVTCLAHYVHRQTNGPRPRLEHGLLAVAIGFNVVALALPPLARVHVYSSAHVVMLALLVYLSLHALRHWRASGQAVSLGLALVCLLVLLGGIHDVVITMPVQWSSMQFVRELARHRYYLTPYGAPLASLLLGLHLARRFVATLSKFELLNADLERRVEASRQALARHFEAQRVHERSQAAGVERERIVREMHDGIGGHLMTALRGVERGAFGKERIADVLQESLDELRLLIDASAASTQLMAALAAWRNRWDPRLEALGVAMSWQVDDALVSVELHPEVVLHLMRILQEAVTNTLKHAQASEVAVRAVLRDDRAALHMEIGDNGVGLCAAGAGVATGHHGLASMRARARAIGAQIEIGGVPAGGTRVVVDLPLGGGA
jgi:signal transduction histidine kinase